MPSKKECNRDCMLNLEGYCQLKEFEGFDGSECNPQKDFEMVEVQPDEFPKLEALK